MCSISGGLHSWQPTETEGCQDKEVKCTKRRHLSLALAPSATPACISILISGARLPTVACNTHCTDSWHVEEEEVREREGVCATRRKGALPGQP